MIFTLHLWNIFAAVGFLLFLYSRFDYLWDKQQPGQLLLFFFGGVVSVLILDVIWNIYIPEIFFPILVENEFLYQVFIVGISEETSKFLVFAFLAHAYSSFKEPQDGVLLGALIGLGFGFVENMMYFGRYPGEVFMFIRPLLTSPGHAIYGGIWGGIYSQAVYANALAQDRRAWGNAIFGIAVVALIHGIYNSAVGWGWVGFGAGILVDILALGISTWLFIGLTDLSPYRALPLGRAAQAVQNLRRGLWFNPRCSVLNRNMGIYLMYLGKYKIAAGHLTTATVAKKISPGKSGVGRDYSGFESPRASKFGREVSVTATKIPHRNLY